MLGVEMGMAAQQRDLSRLAGYDPYSSENHIPISPTATYTVSAGANDTLSIGNADTEAEEPPDEFTQLSNHKFHELLNRFYKLT